MIEFIAMLLIGLLMLSKGSDFSVDNASALAKKLGVSAIVIGLTVVALGTSMPELFVSFYAALSGKPDIAIGNIIGSNIANIGLILGLAALIAPMAIKEKTIAKEMPIMIAASIAFILLGLMAVPAGAETMLSRIDGLLLLVLFAYFMVYIMHSVKSEPDAVKKEFEKEIHAKKQPALTLLFFTMGGIAVVVIGANIFVEGSVGLARIFGISEEFIGLTLVAIGTSLPELFVSVRAAMKKEADIAVGNIVGSNIFNILFILGISSFISPIKVSATFLSDSAIMLAFAIALMALTMHNKSLSKGKGILLLAGYTAFVWLAMA